MSTPAGRRAHAQLAAHSRWAKEGDRAEALAPARRGQDLRFAREVDPDGVLSPEELAVRIKSARQAHMALMRLRRAQRAQKRKEKAA